MDESSGHAGGGGRYHRISDQPKVLSQEGDVCVYLPSYRGIKPRRLDYGVLILSLKA